MVDKVFEDDLDLVDISDELLRFRREVLTELRCRVSDLSSKDLVLLFKELFRVDLSSGVSVSSGDNAINFLRSVS